MVFRVQGVVCRLWGRGPYIVLPRPQQVYPKAVRLLCAFILCLYSMAKKAVYYIPIVGPVRSLSRFRVSGLGVEELGWKVSGCQIKVQGVGFRV